MSSTEQRVAIVTGGSGGIGRECATRLAEDGMAVVVHYAGNQQKADEVVGSIVDGGGSAVAARADVGDEGEVAALFERAEDAFGGVDVVVNTAALAILGPLTELKFDDFDRMFRTNVRGAFIVSRQAAWKLREGGAIINFSTSVRRLALANYTAYVASKGAIEVMTPILAKELEGKDITANTVAPGPTATDLFLEGKSEELLDQLKGMTPMQRLGKPADIAEVVAFLAGPGRWINGQTVYANGGIA